MNDNEIKKSAESELNELLGMFNRTTMQEQRNACVQMYNVYKGFCDAGFTEDQAFTLVNSLLIAAVSGGSGKGKDA